MAAERGELYLVVGEIISTENGGAESVHRIEEEGRSGGCQDQAGSLVSERDMMGFFGD